MTKLPYIIVGQGLAGSMLALEMGKANIPFQIVASPSKTSASIVAAGMFNPLVFKRVTKSWLVDETLPFAMGKYMELETFFHKKFLYKIDIVKPLSKQEYALWKEKKEAGELDTYISEITSNEKPFGLHGFFAYGKVANSGYLDTSLFLQTLFSYFLGLGKLIQADFFYKDVKLVGDLVFWKGKEVAGILFCDGYHAINNPFFKFVGFSPSKGELLLVNVPGLIGGHIYTKKVYVLPVGKSRFKVGSTYNWGDLSDNPTDEGRASIEERFKELVSLPYKVEGHWAGVRPTIKDRRPVLGFHPDYPALGMFNGLGTKGVMLAPYFAKEMVKLIHDNNYKLPSEADLKRFF